MVPGRTQHTEPRASVASVDSGCAILAGLPVEQVKIVEMAMSKKQHLGIWCDATGVVPITGTRYTKQLPNDTYDICEAAFKKLPAAEQATFVAIKIPDIKVVVKTVKQMWPAIESAIAAKQHLGIWCDVSGASPITGIRYTKQLRNDTYDV
eukprot:SAG31_NODE_24827_length_473_cov_1.355615_1_plen_150_part_01